MNGSVEGEERADRSTVLAVWLFLLAATAITAVVGLEHWTGQLAGALLLALAFLKVHLVAQYFMEARHAAPWLRLVLRAYAGGVFAVLLSLYLFL